MIASRITSELTDDNYHRFHRAYSLGLQEYVEARALYAYIDDNSLIEASALESELQEQFDTDETSPSLPPPPSLTTTPSSSAKNNEKPCHRFQLDRTDYVLGIADLTGELMRRAVANSGNDEAMQIHSFLNVIECALQSLSQRYGIAKDMQTKLKILRQSVTKVQKSCFDSAVRRAEYDTSRTVAGSGPVKRDPKRRKTEIQS